jgi:hypothetical protein
MRVRIIDTPPGEAPLEVRQAWKGLVLPVAQGQRGPSTWWSAGVLTGPRNAVTRWLRAMFGRFDRAYGYPVESRLAFEALKLHAPDAESWWRANTPHLYEAGRCLLFHASACEPEPENGAPW